MTIVFQDSFDSGGTEGTTLVGHTTGVLTGTGSFAASSAAQGLFGANFGSSSYLTYNPTSANTLDAEHYGRMYIKTPATYSTNSNSDTILRGMIPGSSTFISAYQYGVEYTAYSSIGTTNHQLEFFVYAANGLNSGGSIGNFPISLNTVYRIEWHHYNLNNSHYVQFRVFTVAGTENPNAVPDFDSGAQGYANSSLSGRIQIGRIGANYAKATDPGFDSIAIGDAAQGWLGPYGQATVAFTTLAGMSLSGILSQLAPINLASQTSMNFSFTDLHVNPPQALPTEATANLVIGKGPSFIPILANLVASASLYDPGILARFSSNIFSATSSLRIQETESVIGFSAKFNMQFLTLGTIAGTLPLGALASFINSAVVLRKSDLSLSSQASLLEVTNRTVRPSVWMGAQASVSQTELLLLPYGVQIYPKALLTLSEPFSAIGAAVTIFATTSQLLTAAPNRVVPSSNFRVFARMIQSSQSVRVSQLVLGAISALNIANVEVSELLMMSALAFLIVDNEPDLVLDVPYLTVQGDHSEMSFFVTSYPNRGDVRQEVTRVS